MPLLYPEIERSGYVKSRADLTRPDKLKFPLIDCAHFWDVTLNPGDILYIPPHIWHFVENISDTIAVGYRFSHLGAALSRSISMTMIRLLSMNPPIWKTMEYGKLDTNLIWAKNAEKLKKYRDEYYLANKDRISNYKKNNRPKLNEYRKSLAKRNQNFALSEIVRARMSK